MFILLSVPKSSCNREFSLEDVFNNLKNSDYTAHMAYFTLIVGNLSNIENIRIERNGNRGSITTVNFSNDNDEDNAKSIQIDDSAFNEWLAKIFFWDKDYWLVNPEY